MPSPAPKHSAVFIRLATLLALALLPVVGLAQGLRVTVRDSLLQEPVVGAGVLVAGTTRGATTDATGTAVLTPAPATALVRYRTGCLPLALNGEDLLDYRQTRRKKVLQGSVDNPTFLDLWAPVEGRVVNLALTWRWAARP